jgi:predicted transcriptional regulator
VARQRIPRLAQTKIRLPTALRRYLQREADKHKRPLNAEIIERLEQSRERQEREAIAEAAAEKAFGKLVERCEWFEVRHKPGAARPEQTIADMAREILDDKGDKK